MEEEEENMPLFWLQAANTRHRPRSLPRQASSIFLNSGVFLTVLLAVAFTFVFVVVPPVGSFTSQIWRPQSIKKNWDSLNLVLVLFAIVCGFLSRNGGGGNESTSYYQDQSLSNVQTPSHPSTPSQRWFEYQDRTMNYNTLSRLRSFSSYPDLRQESLERRRFYDDSHLNNYRFSTSNDHHHNHHHHPPTPSQRWFEHQERTMSYNSMNRLRSSSSYPDLRQESLERWRIYDDDDTHLNNYRFSTSNDQIPHHYPQPVEEPKRQEEDVGVKDIDVDTFVINQKEVSYPSSPPPFHPSPPSPLPPSPPPKLVRRKVKRTHQDLEYEKRTDQEEKVPENLYNIPPPPPPPPPPIFSKNEKRRGKDFLISLRRKKKKQRQKSVENLDRLFNPQPTPTSTLPLITPPPPPPLPPPPHFLQNLFSKKGKTKKLHPVPPPPPPPPVARVSKVVSRKVSSRTKVHVAPVTSHDKPPKTVNTSSFNSEEENVESGNASPLIPLPPPPPPPFKMRAWRFVRDGDYVRVGSFNSSRSGSPELDSIEDATSEKDQSSPMAAADGSDSAATALFCPSPDVDTKADNFIARFKAGLQLEKVNSARRRSNLGPEASTS